MDVAKQLVGVVVEPVLLRGIRVECSAGDRGEGLTTMAEQVWPRPFTSSHAAGAAAVHGSGARR